VRADRNLYSKNLIESQDEIQEMKRKFKIMQHQIEQLKEEISAKDLALVKEHFDHMKVGARRPFCSYNHSCPLLVPPVCSCFFGASCGLDQLQRQGPVLKTEMQGDECVPLKKPVLLVPLSSPQYSCCVCYM